MNSLEISQQNDNTQQENNNLHNKNNIKNIFKNKSSSNQKVQVLLRIRPFLKTQDQQQFITIQKKQRQKQLHQQITSLNKNNKVIVLNKPGNYSYMKFTDVSINNTQEQIYQKFHYTILQSLQYNINSTIFAYGQTGAGKTYTIIGDCPQTLSNSNLNLNFQENLYAISKNNQSRGILPRTLQTIINIIKKRKDTRINISFYQIYNDKVYDLLDINSGNNIKPLEIRQNKNGDISIPNLLSIQVISLNQAINQLAEGIKNRVTSATNANIKSSRSHSIFQIKLQRLIQDKQNQDNFSIATTLIRIVDLAGSQKFNVPIDLSSQQRQIRLQQLKSINGSLSKLGHCISALTHPNRTHIPFRQSKLTRLLSDSLLGSGKIRLIVCISPSMSAMNQTISTLQFANQVKKAIFQKPIKQTTKKYVSLEEHQVVLQQLQKQRRTRKQLQYIIIRQKQRSKQKSQKSSSSYERHSFSNKLRGSVSASLTSGDSNNKKLQNNLSISSENNLNIDLLRDNDYLKQQVFQLQQKLKAFIRQRDSQQHYQNEGINGYGEQYGYVSQYSPSRIKKGINQKSKKQKSYNYNLKDIKTTHKNQKHQQKNKTTLEYYKNLSKSRSITPKNQKSPIKISPVGKNNQKSNLNSPFYSKSRISIQIPKNHQINPFNKIIQKHSVSNNYLNQNKSFTYHNNYNNINNKKSSRLQVPNQRNKQDNNYLNHQNSKQQLSIRSIHQKSAYQYPQHQYYHQPDFYYPDGHQKINNNHHNSYHNFQNKSQDFNCNVNHVNHVNHNNINSSVEKVKKNSYGNNNKKMKGYYANIKYPAKNPFLQQEKCQSSQKQKQKQYLNQSSAQQQNNYTMSIQEKVRKFMTNSMNHYKNQQSNIDIQVQQKIKKRLQQIKNQIKIDLQINQNDIESPIKMKKKIHSNNDIQSRAGESIITITNCEKNFIQNSQKWTPNTKLSSKKKDNSDDHLVSMSDLKGLWKN